MQPRRLALLRDRQHYDELVTAMRGAEVSLWIASANLKDVRVEAPIGTRARTKGRYVSLLGLFGELRTRGVELRLLHAAPPSRPFRAELARTKLAGAVRQCPRVHLKMVAVDGALLYLGSANFTGAGLGAKNDGRRNFEAGILTDDEQLLDEMQSAFDDIWSGRACGGCRMRSLCPAPIDVRYRAT
jgi:phosphatidylserine/phosphatidylglycerophosphate/cardiolipin synthase-like enzyme